jgi:hypothetical protein
MVKRKKRLLKGVESLQKQIEIHEEKKRIAEKEGKVELADYYEREIKAKTRDKERKEETLEKQ